MRSKINLLALLALATFTLMAHSAHGQPEQGTDRTLSPYFLVRSDDPGLDPLPLKSTSVEANISGVIADVTVRQIYENEGEKPLEAVYIFPASTRAAVYGMKMTIGERTITATIRKREEARREYDEAKRTGKSASLLEQHRPNVFQMSVANILPSDVITVELRYTELLVPTDTIYEFVYPTVVGPRYSNHPAAGAPASEKWVENPYLHEGEPPTYGFDITVNLAAGLPIRQIACSSHRTDITYESPSFALIRLDSSEKPGGNRDFILNYCLAGDRVETGLLLFEGEQENSFLLMVQPPKRIRQAQIPPREYIFIVDVSGSMRGFPLDISKRLLKDLIASLRPMDRFNVLLFAGGSSVMAEQSLPASTENVRHAINLIERQRGGGGTELLPALRRALSLPKPEGHARTVVIATDGYVTVEEEAFDLIRNNLDNANMFAFGIGSSVNRHLIEGMARVGMGEPFVITRPEEASRRADKFRRLIQSPLLTGIQIDFNDLAVYDVEPRSIPDVLADRPVVVFGKWRGMPKGVIRLSGTAGDGPFAKTVQVAEVKPLETNSALRYLWARHRIALLSDYNRLKARDERVKEITDLGLSYNLLTAYTSFVAVDTQIRRRDGETVTVKQPLPLPQGVSDSAVGGRARAQNARVAMVPSSGEKEALKEECGRHGKQVMDRIAYRAALATSPTESSHVELAEVTVSGDLSRESIQRFLEGHLPSINHCYNQASGQGIPLTGRVVCRLVIDSKGRVTKMEIDSAWKGNKILKKCLIRKLKKLRYPIPSGSRQGILTLAFLFK